MTNDYNKRFSQHKSLLKQKKHFSKKMQLDYDMASKLYDNCLDYKILYETEDEEFAKVLEYLFLYKAFAKKEKLYNKIQVRFPTEITKYNREEIKEILDNRTLLHAYFNKEIGDEKFKQICKFLNKENLIQIINE